MKVLVDTVIWSLALRRKSHSANESAKSELASLVQDRRVAAEWPVTARQRQLRF